MNKPFSQACVNNRDPILAILSDVLKSAKHVLEIGSGTGQHAVYFAKHLPHLVWQPSDLAENIPGIQIWMKEIACENINVPIVFNVEHNDWPSCKHDTVYSANTAHIMPWTVARKMIYQGGLSLPVGGRFLLYGPFNYNGDYTSDSNRQFDIWLKSVREHQGIRNFEDVQSVANAAGLTLEDDFSMPANNRLLSWVKS